ncbi:hypothetical protein PAN31117_04673 [Pandoraea anapnoica]|uniref:DUF2635 domain-containing protein n=1 Tax=Pandoraea anapnoica TaxID=2508301 RepID=A0A5E5AII9_9BURK|nr:MULTISPECIES: hypothetical protein [Pandoraea]VVE14753.1 hypothetical protein PIN31009_02817 [Pandoraea iniqua]VVE73324.1 hypothetical protein PAN31117_04673 [Pandoraea anapnoica]
MKVIARKGVRVPCENHSRKYITDAKAGVVKESAYYMRRVFDGDLMVVEDVPQVEAVEAVEAKPDAEAPVTTAKRGGKGA